MNVLVTGCAGFIGSYVARLLLRQGHSVLGIDYQRDVALSRLQSSRLEFLTSDSKFSYHRINITNIESLRSTLVAIHTRSPISAIINLAARAGVRGSVAEPRAYLETNTLGCLNLLELSKDLGIGKFILASTSSVYGAGVEGPVKEDFQSSRPLSPYAASKKAAETLLYSYHHLYGIDSVVLRYFTVYGPAGRPDMSIFRFIRGIAEGEAITVYGDGTQQRDFTYVTDVARGTVAALDLKGYETMNLGNENPVSVNKVVATIERLVGRDAQVNYEESHPSDPLLTWADIGRAKSLLNWTPEVDLEEGIRRTVEWYMENREWACSLG